MTRSGGIIALLLLVVALAAGAWWYWTRRPEPAVPREPATATAASEPDAGEPPEAKYPLPESTREHAPSGLVEDEGGAQPAEPEPLPTLEHSDRYMYSVLRRVFTPGVLEDWLKNERIVERIVVTVNSLDGHAISLRFWPIGHIEGLPQIERDGDTLRWSEANNERYRPLVEILQATPPADLARAYFRNYPLFQQAYAGLGLEQTHFNDRLVEIVDHLLGAPAVEPGFEVKQPKVLYQFADPELEAQSWGRKLLMRMGPDNAAAVKQWLRAFRAELVRGAEKGDVGTATNLPGAD